jgi:hypothetical protein
MRQVIGACRHTRISRLALRALEHAKGFYQWTVSGVRPAADFALAVCLRNWPPGAVWVLARRVVPDEMLGSGATDSRDWDWERSVFLAALGAARVQSTHKKSGRGGSVGQHTAVRARAPLVAGSCHDHQQDRASSESPGVRSSCG